MAGRLGGRAAAAAARHLPLSHRALLDGQLLLGLPRRWVRGAAGTPAPANTLARPVAGTSASGLGYAALRLAHAQLSAPTALVTVERPSPTNPPLSCCRLAGSPTSSTRRLPAQAQHQPAPRPPRRRPARASRQGRPAPPVPRPRSAIDLATINSFAETAIEVVASALGPLLYFKAGSNPTPKPWPSTYLKT